MNSQTERFSAERVALPGKDTDGLRRNPIVYNSVPKLGASDEVTYEISFRLPLLAAAPHIASRRKRDALAGRSEELRMIEYYLDAVFLTKTRLQPFSSPRNLVEPSDVRSHNQRTWQEHLRRA